MQHNECLFVLLYFFRHWPTQLHKQGDLIMHVQLPWLNKWSLLVLVHINDKRTSTQVVKIKLTEQVMRLKDEVTLHQK